MTARSRRLSELIARAEVRPDAALGADPLISGVCLDSRVVAKGDLFFALPGARQQGEAFVPEALARGARAVVAGSERPATIPRDIAWVRVAQPRAVAGRLAREWFGRPDTSLRLIGVTGTNGKTTVTWLVEGMARAHGLSAGRIGTTGYVWGGIEHPAPRTTPEAPDLFGMLAAMRDAEVDLVAMEVSSHALTLGRVEGARFQVGALVGFGRDHLDFHQTLDRYFEAKATLFDRLDPEHATAVLPADDEAGRILAKRTRAKVVTFGRSPASDVRITGERSGLDGSFAVLQAAKTPIEIRTPLVGRFNVDNVAVAAACALAAGCSPAAVSAGAAAVARVPGRVEAVRAGQPFAVLVDYAHTPEALTRLLESVRALTEGRIVLLFGCGGERDRGKRPEMGRVAANGAEVVILTSDNPRGEDPAVILEEIAAGARSVADARERVRIIPDRSEAIAVAIGGARPKDTVLIAGKGHETTQTVGDRIVHLDDRELAFAALGASGYVALGGRRGRA